MPLFTRGVAAFSYKAETAGLINRMKKGNQRLAAYFGDQMAEAILPILQGEEGEFLLVPVPLTKERKMERGYNQAERLAEALQRRLQKKGITVRLESDLLEKHRETGLQKQKTARERIENVRGAYHVHKRKLCEGKKVLLVDDILTTGATGSECARRLLSAKAKEVIFLVAAAVEERK
jgi:ComF family protein